MSYSFLAETQSQQFVNFPQRYFSNWSKICRHCTVNSVLQVRIDQGEFTIHVSHSQIWMFLPMLSLITSHINTLTCALYFETRTEWRYFLISLHQSGQLEDTTFSIDLLIWKFMSWCKLFRTVEEIILCAGKVTIFSPEILLHPHWPC